MHAPTHDLWGRGTKPHDDMWTVLTHPALRRRLRQTRRMLRNQRQRARTHPRHPRTNRPRHLHLTHLGSLRPQHRVQPVPRRPAAPLQGQGRVLRLHAQGRTRVRRHLDDAQLCLLELELHARTLVEQYPPGDRCSGGRAPVGAKRPKDRVARQDQDGGAAQGAGARQRRQGPTCTPRTS
jgi:hypothetical protein